MNKIGSWQQTTLDAIKLKLMNDVDVLALVLLGSATDPAGLDAWSDLDVMLVVEADALPRFFPDASWLRFLGEPFALEHHADAHSVLIRLALTDGRRIDVGVTTEAALADADQWANRAIWKDA